MPLEIIREDITRMHADAIVNSANPDPVIGRGVDSAIHRAAGPFVLEERERVGRIDVGCAAATGAGNLHARMLIHTVGPVWRGGDAGEAEAVAGCYRSSLELAAACGCRSIAFPLISTGTYGFPKTLALSVATRTIGEFLEHCDMDVYLVVYDAESFAISQELFDDVKNFIDECRPASEVSCDVSALASCVPEACFSECAPSPLESRRLQSSFGDFTQTAPECPRIVPRSLENVVDQVEEGFSEALLRIIDERGMTDPEVYKRANIDRKLFSKIRSKSDYRPSKATALSLAVALRLNLDETRDLIGRAGYALTHASKGDIIVEYFIVRGIWDIYRINETLFAFDQPLLGR